MGGSLKSIRPYLASFIFYAAIYHKILLFKNSVKVSFGINIVLLSDSVTANFGKC